MWDRARRVGQGFRTMLCSIAVALVGIADIAGGIDVSPLIGFFLPNKDAIGVVMVSLGLLFAVLRFFTSSVLFERHPRIEGQIAPDKFRDEEH